MFCFKAPALRLLALGTIERHPVFWGVDQDLAEAKRRQDAQAKKGGVRNA
jgi:preprotein translocase subunit SecD/SecD/SecF fusion protein